MGAEHPVVRATESPLVTSNDQSNQSPGIREALLAVENQSRALASSEGDSSAKSEQWMKNLGTFPGNRKEWEKMLIASNDLSGLVLPGDGADAAAAAVSEDRVGKSLRFNVQVDAHQLSPDEFESLHTMIRESAGDEVAVDPKTQSMTIKRPTYDLLAKLSENDSLNLFEQSALRSNPGTFSPISISPLNLDARVTHLADKASADHDITGKGVTVCVWDEGKVRTTHQEFQLANGTSRVSQSDGASVLSVHSTHVTGTIGAKGEVNQAMGMATDVNILAHDWINDVSEMRNQAAAGAACSNHSYGYSLGWEWSNSGWVWYGSPSQATDYRFGKYHLASRQFDDVAYSHPTMSVFVAAGNDRNNNPPPGVLHSVAQNGQTSTTTRLGDGRYADGYDCMGALAVGKNVITIGAIHDIVGGEATPDRVKVTDFSSWGPTDEGRIKPDVVGNGFQLFSTTITGDDQYHTTSGTSMATPAATGVGAILVECFRKHGIATPRSDQMKSVLIHTAMSPNPGPDYRIGWGSIRADLAADLIAGKGGVLLTSSVQDHDVVWSGKSTGKPIRVTLVWLDPAAEPTTGGANVRTKTLVNDLDLKLIAPDGTTTHYPWSLNPDSPAIAATATSGNHVDNVERVDIASPSNGTWKVEVSWPGNHDSSQPFAWVVSGLTDLTK